jgi:hypothetical protein
LHRPRVTGMQETSIDLIAGSGGPG